MPPTNHHDTESPHGVDPRQSPAWPGRSESLLPGEQPVRVSRVRTSTLHDPPPDSGIFTGLTPRLAATLLATYTSPGDVVVDTTADLAVEGTARAGARDYHHLALFAEPPPHTGSHPFPASLVLLRWPDAATTGGSGGGSRIAAGHASDDTLERALRAGRQLVRPDGHLILVQSRPGNTDYRDHVRHLTLAARAAGVGSLQHVVVVATSGPCGSHAVSSDAVVTEARDEPAGWPVWQLVFVLSARRSRRRD